MTRYEIILLVVHATVPHLGSLALRGRKLAEADILVRSLCTKTGELGDEVDSLLLRRLKNEVLDMEGSQDMLALLRQIANELNLSINLPWEREFAQ